MTVKERNILDFYWRQLYDAVREYQRGVTVGELAKHVGVSRSTANKYVRELIKSKAAYSEKFVHWNKQKATRYGPVGGAR